MENKVLTFVLRDGRSGHEDACSLCGRTSLGRKAVAASFAPDEPEIYAAIYCFRCIERLAKVRARAERKTKGKRKKR